MELEKTILDPEKGFGLVLSGGGAWGAYEAGVIKCLDEAGIKFEVISGTSAGSLNAALTAAGKIPDMIRIWETISPNKVLKFTPKNLMHGAIMDNTPLEKLIREEIKKEDADKIINSPTRLVIVSSCLQDKKEITETDFKNYEQIVESLLSSCTIPLTFKPREYHSQGSVVQRVDGGIINNFPLDEAIQNSRCKNFFSVSLFPHNLQQGADYHYNDFLHIGMRTLEIMFTNSYLREISDVKEKINLAYKLKEIIEPGIFRGKKKRKKADELYRQYERYDDMQIVEINPVEEFPGGVLDFMSEKTKKMMNQGYEDALKTLERVKIV